MPRYVDDTSQAAERARALPGRIIAAILVAAVCFFVGGYLSFAVLFASGMGTVGAVLGVLVWMGVTIGGPVAVWRATRPRPKG